MSDQMPMPQSSPQDSQAPSSSPADVVESNRSYANPLDAMTMHGRASQDLTEETPLGEFLTNFMGLDLNAPWVGELQRFSAVQQSNQTAMGKVANIAEGNNVRAGAGADAAMTLVGASTSPPGAGSAGVDSLLGMV